MVETLPHKSPLKWQKPVLHWSAQRVSAVALLPLSIWLLIFLHQAFQAGYAETLAWLSTPFNTVALLLWLIVSLYHAALGIQVVLEDYTGGARRQQLILLSNGFFILLGVAAVVAVIFIHISPR